MPPRWENPGKSLLMIQIAKNTDSTIVIDLRENPDILQNFTEALQEQDWIKVVNGTIKISNGYLKQVGKIKIPGLDLPLERLIDGIEIPALELSLKRLIDGIIVMHGNITLIVDEANRTFTIDPDSPNKKLDVDKALGSLELLTRLAKQEKRVLSF